MGPGCCENMKEYLPSLGKLHGIFHLEKADMAEGQNGCLQRRICSGKENRTGAREWQIERTKSVSI